MSFILSVLVSFLAWVTVCSYTKLAIFTTNVDAEKQCLINLSQLADCGVLNRHFCQTCVCVCPAWATTLPQGSTFFEIVLRV